MSDILVVDQNIINRLVPRNNNSTTVEQEINKDVLKRLVPKSSITPDVEVTAEKPGAFESFGAGVTSDLATRSGEISQTAKDFASGQIDLPIAAIQTVGKTIGAGFDVAGEVFNLGAAGVSFVVPDSIEDPIKEKTAQAFGALLQTGAGQQAIEAIEKGELAWTNYKANNPQGAKTIESLMNIGLFFAPVKVRAATPPKQKPVSIAERVVNTLVLKGEQQEKNIYSKKAYDLIMPYKPLAEFSREVKNPITRQSKTVQIPTKFEEGMIETLAKLKIDPGASAQKARDIIQDNIESKSIALETRLKNDNVTVTLNESSQAIKTAVDKAKNEPGSFVNLNEMGKLVDTIADEAIRILANSPQDALGILKSRQALDNFLKTYKGEKSSFPDNDKVETALSIAVRDIRASLNDLVAEKVPSAKVKESFKEVTNLYRARVPIIKKADGDATTSIGRLSESITRSTGFKLPTTPLALLATVGGAGALAAYAGVPIASGALGILGYRKLLTPSAKKYLAKLVLVSDKALKTVTDPDMLKQMRMDRAVILELLETSKVSNEIEENTEEK